MVGRFGLSDVRPVVGSTVSGEFPARAVVGEQLPVSARVFREGHDAVAATVVVRDPAGKKSQVVRMVPGAPGTDRWHADVVLDRQGSFTFTVEAWSDPMSTWHHAVTVKIEAGQGAEDLANDFESGARLFEQLAKNLTKVERPRALAAARALRDTSLDVEHRVAPALEDYLQDLVRDFPVREYVSASPRYPLWADRPRALFGSWYEFFPRSIGAELAGDPVSPAKPLRHGTFKDAAEHLDYVASLGFDVVYLPPIHPIGEVNRKGPNNTLVAASWDVGSPWAIGSKDGGHDAVHPDLGTLADFKAFVKRARQLDMEVALDLALQCAPDHPWVEAHPEWFTTKPDGTIAYAENPPKKYQDIYPLNFDNDPAGLYAECLRVVRHWIAAGVRIFRVDNPHTKPINFWQWLIAEVRKTDPDVLFLAEAFTRPAMMHELGKIGFHQSYTYYTWRTEKDELAEYVEELAEAEHYMRPNFFVNTPDILHGYLQTGGPGAFAIRAVLAATLSPTWGVYSGYELYEHLPAKPGSEEYLDSEKYQLRPRDLAGAIADGRSLAPFIQTLNRIRREHPALQQLRNVTFHQADNPDILVFSKRDDATGDTVVVACTVNPHEWREATVSLDLEALGLDWHTGFTVRDLLDGTEYQWGEHNYVRLDPFSRSAHVFEIVRPL
ncbi:alpha-1,4-glucan:maltose-1-phosphate maltosyltransferase [Jatrophihabitans endophyticus]|uniref:Alpha-1,4-glucan:maltose-1-phosphate maltosyltransferase n=1 Tax=Jatrophihabitans endophyticus TaxID=1206085 RepID=A0A1M5DEU4_9ACTN|nr:alpha-1,4-glucan--maltose-1-phosphate maltosyltransferase [Jatrophihabitans endophyticus]SHF65401.1 alpha-1,4-glucan:maltose-1-phosphate maltosyltransferase [Jatrophihabitans endophyticus]